MLRSKEEQQAAVHRSVDEPRAANLSHGEIAPDSYSSVRKHLDAIAQLRLSSGAPLVSVILFGSSAKRAFASKVSDVDLIVVLPDTASVVDLRHIREQVFALEIEHGFRKPSDRTRRWLRKYVERLAGYSLSGFVCTRSDLLSGEVARVFGLSPFEALFVDRIVFAGVIVSAVTVWGEELLAQVPIPVLRRRDVMKALFSFVSATVMSAAVFPLFSNATKYAMGVLKHSLDSCYFCYHQKTASLQEEVDFFGARVNRRNILDDLLNRRRSYTPSFAFILGCLPVLFQLHLRTARDNRFPQLVSRSTI
ncbi:MAG TPA: nucleotidyltransferase domain-containing protein [Acidisarcina sp.]